MKKQKLRLTLLAMMVFITSTFAGPGAPPQTPIDGGLSLLLAAGGLFGLKKLYSKSKKFN